MVVARLRLAGDVVEGTEVLRAGEEDDAVARVEGKFLGVAALVGEACSSGSTRWLRSSTVNSGELLLCCTKRIE